MYQTPYETMMSECVQQSDANSSSEFTTEFWTHDYTLYLVTYRKLYLVVLWKKKMTFELELIA